MPVGVPNPNRVHVECRIRDAVRVLESRPSATFAATTFREKAIASSNVIQPLALWSASSTCVRPPSSFRIPVSLIRVFVVTSPFSIAGDRGQHLEDRAGLVDGADDRVDEAGRIAGGDRRVVVAVVGRIGGLGQDLAGVRVHDDCRDRLGPVGRPGGEDLLLDRELEPRVDREAEVLARRAGILDDGRLRDEPRCDVALGVDDPGPAGQLLLVELLDAVLAGALAIDEPQQLGREGRVRAAAAPAGRRGRAPAPGPGPSSCPAAIAARIWSGDGRVEGVGEDDVLAVGGLAVGQGRRRRRPSRPRTVTSACGDVAPASRRRSRTAWPPAARARWSSPGRRRRCGRRCRRAGWASPPASSSAGTPRPQADRAGPPASTRGARGAPTPTDAKTIRRKSARRRESVRPIDRSGDGQLPADDEWGRQLGQPGVDRQLADRRLLAEAVEVGQQLGLPDEERIAVRVQPLHVVAGRRDADRLGQREERQHERDDDPAEDERDAGGSAASTDRAANATARQGRRVDDARPPREERGARAGARVDRHLVADREAQARSPGVEERERVGLGGHAEAVQLELVSVGLLRRTVCALVQLVLAATVRPSAAGLVSLAHGTPPLWVRWLAVRRARVARRLGGEALGGPQTGAPGAWVGGDLGRRRRQGRVGSRDAAGDCARRRRPAAPAGRCSRAARPRRSA